MQCQWDDVDVDYVLHLGFSRNWFKYCNIMYGKHFTRCTTKPCIINKSKVAEGTIGMMNIQYFTIPNTFHNFLSNTCQKKSAILYGKPKKQQTPSLSL
jgi:hypothetical protein